ncbi:acyltransferase [bacterium]|nr:acyltransferase [bacterium]
MTADALNRKYELDWLRVFAILVVFLYHSTRFFNLGDWHVKNVDTYVWVEIWNVFVTRWMMPLFFIISGASLFYAIGKPGGWRRFYIDKFLRLFIPVLLASVTHGALQVYLERLNHGRFSGSFLSFIPDYFKGVYSGIGYSGNFANVGMHLWYLLFLFLYSLICYRLFVWFKAGGRKILERITTMFSLPGLIYLWFTLPLVIMKALIPSMVLEVGNGGWGFLYYLWFLISGFLIVSSDRLQPSIKKQRWISLFLGLVLSIGYLYLLFGVSHTVFQGRGGDWISSLLSFFCAWSWLFAILGFGMQHLAFNHPVLQYTNEGVLPFFIMHQTVLLGFGYLIMSWEIHDGLKWAVVFFSSFFIIWALYGLLIRKLDLLRFLFGMKTSHSFFLIFQKRSVLIILPVLWISLTVFAGFNQNTAIHQIRFPMSLTVDHGWDIILNAASITNQSSTGIQIINDEEASVGRAIEFSEGGSHRVEPQPEVYIEMRFSAPAGRYYVWLRGKSDTNSELTDSIWLQVDNQIGTWQGSVHLGNWNTFHPVGVYAWASDVHIPIVILLKHTGDHTIRIQPRQTPHRIDQIWLSRLQYRIPDTYLPVDD